MLKDASKLNYQLLQSRLKDYITSHPSILAIEHAIRHKLSVRMIHKVGKLAIIQLFDFSRMNFSYTDIHIFPIFPIKELPDFYNLNSFEYIRVLRLEKSPKQIV